MREILEVALKRPLPVVVPDGPVGYSMNCVMEDVDASLATAQGDLEEIEEKVQRY